MYKPNKINRSKIKQNTAIEGETIETKFQRILTNNEPITDGAPLIYTERSEGVRPGYDIRTDRFDIALEAMTVVHRSETAQREHKAREVERENKNIEDNSTQTKDNNG